MELVLIFRLADEWFGLEVDDIQEIVESPELNYVPRAPESIIGAINFHGNIVPVLDLPTDMIRQATVSKGDVLSPFEHDDFRLFTEPSGAGGRRSSPCYAPYDHDALFFTHMYLHWTD